MNMILIKTCGVVFLLPYCACRLPLKSKDLSTRGEDSFSKYGLKSFSFIRPPLENLKRGPPLNFMYEGGAS